MPPYPATAEILARPRALERSNIDGGLAPAVPPTVFLLERRFAVSRNGAGPGSINAGTGY